MIIDENARITQKATFHLYSLDKGFLKYIKSRQKQTKQATQNRKQAHRLSRTVRSVVTYIHTYSPYAGTDRKVGKYRETD